MAAAATPPRSAPRSSGKSVALIEKDKVGGTCLHRGCIPTKALLHAAEVAENVRDAAAHRRQRARSRASTPAGVRAYREGIVAKKFKGLEGLVKARGITVVPGEGRLEAGPHRARRRRPSTRAPTSSSRPGSYSRTLPGLEIGGRILTSEQALELDEIPERVVILGGGVIGVEFASVWRSFGADVTIIEALPPSRPERGPRDEQGARAGIPQARHRVLASVCASRVRRRRLTASPSPSRTARHSRPTTCSSPSAAGRSPRGLGYEEAGVALDRGFVMTDERLRTGVAARLGGRRHRPGPAARAPRLPAGHLRRRADRRADPVLVPDSQIPKVTYCQPGGRFGRRHRGAGGRGARRGRRRRLRVQPRRQRQERDHRHRRPRQGRAR